MLYRGIGSVSDKYPYLWEPALCLSVCLSLNLSVCVSREKVNLSRWFSFIFYPDQVSAGVDELKFSKFCNRMPLKPEWKTSYSHF